MSPPHPVATIAASTLFEPSLLDGFELKEFPKGYLLSTPASQPDQIFVVRSGRLKVYLAGANRELSLSLLEPGDIYATHTPAYVRTQTAVSLWVMETRRFAEKLVNDPKITPAMMQVFGRMLTNAITLIDDLAFREVPVRLARFLVGLTERKGVRQDEGWSVALDMGTEDIASLLGTTRQTVSELLNQWERDGLLRRLGRRHLVIPSLAALAERLPG